MFVYAFKHPQRAILHTFLVSAQHSLVIFPMHWKRKRERDRWKEGRKKAVQYLSYKGIQLQNKEMGDSQQAIKIYSEADSKVNRFGIMLFLLQKSC